MRRSMLRLYPDTTRFDKKITIPFLNFFRVLNSDSLQLNLVICMRRSMLRLYPG